MNKNNILKLVLPVALSASLIIVNSVSMAGDLQLKPLKPTKLSDTSNKKSGDSSIVGPMFAPPVTRPAATGINNKKLTPVNAQSIDRNTLNQAPQKASQQKTLTPTSGVRTSTGPEVRIRTYRDDATRFRLPREDESNIRQFKVDYMKYKADSEAYMRKFQQCMAGSYSQEDIRRAGCRETTPVRSCERALVSQCSNTALNVASQSRIKVLETFRKTDAAIMTVKKNAYTRFRIR